jgi:hypothetical protein
VLVGIHTRKNQVKSNFAEPFTLTDLLHSATSIIFQYLLLYVRANVKDIGSMADVPKDLLQEIRKLEEMFTVPKEKLKEITTHFVSELKKGCNRLSDSSPSAPLLTS